MTPPIAHETWFVDEPPMDWSFTFEAATLALLGLAVAVTLLVRVVAARFPGVDVPFIGRMAPYVPFAIRIHLAVGCCRSGTTCRPRWTWRPTWRASPWARR